MHLEKRAGGGKTKYFLAHSYREGAKVHKFRKYLGQDLKPELLAERKKLAEKLILEEIHRHRMIVDPLQFELSEGEIAWIRELEAKIPLKIAHLSEVDWKEFSKLFTYNTNAIEGSRLTQKEVKDLLGEDKWPDKPKEEIAEAFGVDEAITLIRNTNEQVSTGLIKRIHKTVFRNSKPFAGKFRKKGEDVVVLDGRGIVVHEGAPPQRVPYLLRQLTAWYNRNRSRYPGLVLAAAVHNQFENIHPFADGNGRVGRILLNNILIKHGLPPINIGLKNRLEYYASLQAYDKHHDLKPTLDLYFKEYASLKKELYGAKTSKRGRVKKRSKAKYGYSNSWS